MASGGRHRRGRYYGTLSWNAASGAYTYALDNTKASVQALAQGEVRLETFTFR